MAICLWFRAQQYRKLPSRCRPPATAAAAPAFAPGQPSDLASSLVPVQESDIAGEQLRLAERGTTGCAALNPQIAGHLAI